MKFEQFEQLEQNLIGSLKKFPYLRDQLWSIYFYEKFMDYHRQKLKMGKIIFEIHEINVGEFTLHETVDIRYIRQDNTRTDALRIDNRLAALDWKWDIYNVLAFIIVVSGIIFFLYVQYLNWYNQNLYHLKDGNYRANLIRDFAFDTFFKKSYNVSRKFMAVNSRLNMVMLELCEHFKILK